MVVGESLLEGMTFKLRPEGQIGVRQARSHGKWFGREKSTRDLPDMGRVWYV